MKLQYTVPVLSALIFLNACARYPPMQVAPGDNSQAAQQVREGIIELEGNTHWPVIALRRHCC